MRAAGSMAIHTCVPVWMKVWHGVAQRSSPEHNKQIQDAEENRTYQITGFLAAGGVRARRIDRGSDTTILALFLSKPCTFCDNCMLVTLRRPLCPPHSRPEASSHRLPRHPHNGAASTVISSSNGAPSLPMGPLVGSCDDVASNCPCMPSLIAIPERVPMHTRRANPGHVHPDPKHT